MLPNILPFSPVPHLRDFVWVAELVNGEYISEFDFKTKQKSDFYSIPKQGVLRFGLFGHGMKFYYEVFSGKLVLPHGKFDFVYKTKDKEYKLTDNNILYNDYIAYKRANADFAPIRNGYGHSNSHIIEYTFGYKQKLSFDDIDFNFKLLFKIPYGIPMHINTRLVANREIDGKLQIKCDGIVVEEVDAPLSKQLGGEYSWIIQ